MTVWRGTKKRFDFPYQEIELDKGYEERSRVTSTSTSPLIAVNFCRPDNFTWGIYADNFDSRQLRCIINKIHLPAGFPYIDVNDSIRQTRMRYPSEKEYLLLPQIGDKRLRFDLVRKTLSPDESTPDTELIKQTILEFELKYKNEYWYQHPMRHNIRLRNAFTIYEVVASYV